MLFQVVGGEGVLGLQPWEGNPDPLPRFAGNPGHAALSPDGRWVAYDSDASGRHEVYVRPFVDVDDGEWLISNAGGRYPLWGPAGRELFYFTSDGEMMAVAVRTEPAFASEPPRVLFSGDYHRASARSYDIASDGTRFLLIKENDASPEFAVVLNWFEELKRLVPHGQLTASSPVSPR